MNNTLIILAHPDLSASRINSHLSRGVYKRPNVVISDLYHKYPDFKINVADEQTLLLTAGSIIFQHPFYWYSYPVLLKEWIDKVLLNGFAHGTNGYKLANKILMSAVSADGTFEGYGEEGYNLYTVKELLRPVELTAKYCKMNYLDPFVIYDTDNITDEELEEMVLRYVALIDSLQKINTPPGSV